jgi:hypothetical protein
VANDVLTSSSLFSNSALQCNISKESQRNVLEKEGTFCSWLPVNKGIWFQQRLRVAWFLSSLDNTKTIRAPESG